MKLNFKKNSRRMNESVCLITIMWHHKLGHHTISTATDIITSFQRVFIHKIYSLHCHNAACILCM